MHDFKTTFSSSNALFIFTSQFATSIAALDLTAGRSNMSKLRPANVLRRQQIARKRLPTATSRLRDFWVFVRRECVPKQAQTTAFCVPEAELLEIPTHRIDIEIATDLDRVTAYVDTRHKIQGEMELTTWYHSGIYHSSAADGRSASNCAASAKSSKVGG